MVNQSAPGGVTVTFNGGILLFTTSGPGYYTTNLLPCNPGFGPQLTISFSQPVSNVWVETNRYGFYYYPSTGQTSISIPAPIDANGKWNFGLFNIYFDATNSSSSPQAGSLVANPPTAVRGSTVQVAGAGWVNVPNGEYRLLFDGAPALLNNAPVTQPVNCFTQPNMFFEVPCTAAPGPHTITCQLFDQATQQIILSKDINTFNTSVNPLATLCPVDDKIASVSFEDLNGQPLEPNPILHNEITVNGQQYGGGVRIFPDAYAPGDPANRQVIVKVKIDSMKKGTPVYLRSFDVDDSSGLFNSSMHNGGDNQGFSIRSQIGDMIPNNGEFEGFAGQLIAMAKTGDNGNQDDTASIKFAVTMQPGDNFKIVATTDPTVFDPNRLIINGQLIHDNKANKDLQASMINTPADIAMTSELLTVWRYMHVEFDSMPAPVVPPIGDQDPERNYIRGNILLFNVLQPAPNVNLLEMLTDQVLRDKSYDLENLDPQGRPLGIGRFENGKILIGTTPTVIDGLYGNGMNIIAKQEATIPGKLVDKKNKSISVDIKSMFPADPKATPPTRNRFILSQKINNSGLYVGGSIVIGGISFTIDKILDNENEVDVSSKPGQPPFTLPFILYDDDNSAALPLQYPRDFLLMQESDDITENIYASVYIKPVYDVQSIRQPTFNLNIDDIDPTDLLDQILSGRDGSSGNDYWYVYVQGAWQYDQEEDFDPDLDKVRGAVEGSTISFHHLGSLIYLEIKRDELVYATKNGYPIVGNAAMANASTIPHEVGHQFLLPDRKNMIGGIMEYIPIDSIRWANTANFNFFIPDDRMTLRRSLHPQY